MTPPEITDSDGIAVGSKLGSLVQSEALELFCTPPQEFPSARIRWQLQDQWGPSSSSAAGTTVLVSGTGSLLRIEALDRRHHGLKLRCTASRPVAGAASAAVTLDVFLAPVQALLVRRGPLVAGVTAELECVAWGSRPEPTLHWTLGGRPMASAFSHWDGRNVSTATVTLRPAPADHGRRLVCTASNPRTPAVPPVQDSRRLDVHYPPEVQLETCNAATGWACLRCRVDANPPPLRLTWTRDGEPMRDVPPLSAVLRWRQKQGRLEHYACAAENPLGAASSRPVGLILLEKHGKATMSTALTAALLLLLALVLLLVAFLCILAWNRRRLWLRGLRGRARGQRSGEVLRAASYTGQTASFERAEAHKPA
ncbi:nephrin-like [Rhipicephalus sanguineus]|uniref:nephrin-like n=1 Tax=Rhipicephalus sanguineus TaxID=34632 RepID=UPI001892F839|nr:nephrin-like [Rhipicephalus sanguineus]